MTRKVYLDYGAATPTHPKAIEAMIPYLSERAAGDLAPLSRVSPMYVMPKTSVRISSTKE